MGQSKRMEKDEKRDSWGHSCEGWKEKKRGEEKQPRARRHHLMHEEQT